MKKRKMVEKRVLDRIEREFPERLIVCSSRQMAEDLYREVKEMPGASTFGHLFTQCGVRVAGPLFPNSSGPATVLEAWLGGKPRVVKMLPAYVSLESEKEPGGSEALACKVRRNSKQ